MHRFAVIAFVIGCSSPGPAPTSPTPPPTGSDSGSASAPSTAGLGDKCGEADACAAGQTCVSYFGIAGPSGPEFKSCEITCKGESPCPTGTKCITIADGPGQVCRP